VRIGAPMPDRQMTPQHRYRSALDPPGYARLRSTMPAATVPTNWRLRPACCASFRFQECFGTHAASAFFSRYP